MRSRKRESEDVEAAGKKHKGNRDVGTPLMRHHYGLQNQGATCYLNSVLQVLFMTPEIHERLDPQTTVIDQELRTLFGKLKKKKCGTENITQSLEITNVGQQRDAAECLEKILHKVSSNVSQVFKGQQKYTTTCCKGHIIIEEINPFLTLPLSLKDANDTSYSVESGFEKIFLEKNVSAVYCDKCDEKTEATSECQMVEFPHILILLLKRFDLDYSTMKYVKSDRCVEVPRTLQIKNKTYKLYGIVNHMGGLTGGHYTSTIQSREDETWYEFDDSQVRKVDEEPFSNAGTYNSRTAYLLVYRASESQGDDVKAKDKMGQEVQGLMTERKRAGENEVQIEVSSFSEEPHFPQNQSSHMSKPHQDNLPKVEENRQHSRRRDNEIRNDNKSSASVRKKPAVIALILCGCVIILILIVVLPTVL